MPVELTVVQLAIYKTFFMSGTRKKCINSGQHPWHPEVADMWKTLTVYERSWYVLFNLATFYSDWEALEAIAPNEQAFNQVRKKIYQSHNAYQRDLANITYDKWLAQVQEARRLSEQPTVRRRAARYSPQDIPDDLTRLGTFDSQSPRIPPTVLPSYAGSPGPVRSVTPDEFLATRRTPGPRGVKLEFDKENTQVSRKRADKDSEMPGWYRPQED